MIKVLKPEIAPIGGYNLEYRQTDSTSERYIYSHAGADAEGFQTVYDNLSETVSFGGEDSPYTLNKGVLAAGTMKISSVIYPYPGSPSPSLPTSFTIASNDETVEFILIAKILKLIPHYNPKNQPNDKLAQWKKGEIERHTKQTLHKEGVLQELVSKDGERYMLVSAFGDATNKYDVNEVGGLSGMPLPKGYTYESREIDEEMTIEPLEVAYIIVNSAFNFQRYDTQ